MDESLVVVTFDDIRTKYATNDLALNMLFKADIVGFDISCDNCEDSTTIWDIKKTGRKKWPDGWMYQCGACKVERSIRRESVFYSSPMTLQQICDTIYIFATLHLPQTTTAKVRNSSLDNSGKWFMVMRKCMSLFLDDHPPIMGGEEKIVEGDETCMTQKRKFGVGTVSNATPRWIFAVSERHSPKQRHIYIGEHRTREVIFPIIMRLVIVATRFMTDNFNVYWTLGDVGYVHAMVNHSIEFIDENDSEIHTESVEGGFKHMKAAINRGHGVRTKYLQLHLDEHDFRTMYLNKAPKESWLNMDIKHWNV